MSEGGREFKGFQEEPAVDAGTAGGGRFHLVMMSPPTTTLVSQPDDPPIQSLINRSIGTSLLY